MEKNIKFINGTDRVNHSDETEWESAEEFLSENDKDTLGNFCYIDVILDDGNGGIKVERFSQPDAPGERGHPIGNIFSYLGGSLCSS